MNNMTTLYIVRHGQTDWNDQHRIQGHTDIPLNENGEIQAKELGIELENVNFDKAFSSDLLRAKRTAEIIAIEKDLEIETTHLLREVSYGSFEGNSSRDFFEKFNKWLELSENEKNEHESAEKFKEVESWDSVTSRLLTFLREVSIGFSGKTILIVSHGGVMHNLLIHLGYGSPKKVNKVLNTAYVKLESDGIDFFVKETKGVELSN